MSTHAHVQSVFWFDRDEQDRFLARLKKTLFLSLVLHLVVLLVTTGLRLPHRGERPLASVEVSLVSLPTPIKRTEVQKPVEMPKPSESKPVPVPQKVVERAPIAELAQPPVPQIPQTAPSSKLVAPPARQSIAKDILRDLQLPPDAPQFGDFTPAKAVAQPQPTAKAKMPDLPRIPDVMPDRAVKAPQQASLSEDLNRELEEELKRVKQFQPAAKLDIPKETPVKLAPQQEASVPAVMQPQTMLKTSGSSGTNPFWGRVEAIIRSHWEPPPIDVTGSTYTAVVKFRFFRNGTVKEVGIQQSSGNGYFDDAGKRAVLKPSQFPPFPTDMTEAYQDVEMIFRVGEATG